MRPPIKLIPFTAHVTPVKSAAGIAILNAADAALHVLVVVVAFTAGLGAGAGCEEVGGQACGAGGGAGAGGAVRGAGVAGVGVEIFFLWAGAYLLNRIENSLISTLITRIAILTLQTVR